MNSFCFLSLGFKFVSVLIVNKMMFLGIINCFLFLSKCVRFFVLFRRSEKDNRIIVFCRESFVYEKEVIIDDFLIVIII